MEATRAPDGPADALLAAYGEFGAYGVSSLNSAVGAERAVDLVGGHMQKPERARAPPPSSVT